MSADVPAPFRALCLSLRSGRKEDLMAMQVVTGDVNVPD